MAAENIDDITINYEEEGIQLIKELDKEVISKGAWTTILFKFQEWERAKEAYSPPRYTIRRYRKVKGEYRQQNKFNISSDDQARKIISILERWLAQTE